MRVFNRWLLNNLYKLLNIRVIIITIKDGFPSTIYKHGQQNTILLNIPQNKVKYYRDISITNKIVPIVLVHTCFKRLTFAKYCYSTVRSPFLVDTFGTLPISVCPSSLLLLKWKAASFPHQFPPAFCCIT